MDILSYEIGLEQEVNRTIKSCYPKDWEEDLITHELLKCLDKFFKAQKFYDDLNRETLINLRAYKLKGNVETEYGDIAFLTSVRFDNGIEFQGVANFEAKKRLKDNFNYQRESSNDQYKKISQDKPYSQLLLYDFEPISEYIKPIFKINDWHRFYIDDANRQLITYCACFPLYMVTDGKTVDRNYNRISRTISEQLCRRIFYGIDLHFQKEYIDDIINFDSKNHPKFVVDLQVTHGNTSITEDNINREFLQELYERIE